MGDIPENEPRPRPEPGERRRTLDRPPGERFATSDAEAAGEEAPAAPRQAVAISRALGSAAIGAALMAFLGGPVSATLGLVAIAAVTGWAVGSFLRPSAGPAVALAIAAVVVGLLGVWVFARLEGGVLDPMAYLLQVHGPLVGLDLLAAGIAAFVGSR